MSRHRKSILIVVLLVFVLGGYKLFFGSGPEEMLPTPLFSELCDFDEEDLAAQQAAYQSRASGDQVSAGEVVEIHLTVDRPESLEEVGALFDYEQMEFTVEAEHVRSAYRIEHSGFVDAYDDESVLIKFRLRAQRTGAWTYQILGRGGVSVKNGRFVVVADEQTAVGQLSVDKRFSDKLTVGEDSFQEPFHWVGGKWIAASNYAPCAIDQNNFAKYRHLPLTDQELTKYMDLLVEKNHNGFLLKIAQFPLQSDGYSWDLLWINRAEWIVREAFARGLYVQINLLDTWSRDFRYKVLNNTDGDAQVMNAWQPTNEDLPRIKNYLRTLVARFAAFPNIMWELGNEMEHRPNCGDCFAFYADEYYLPWIRSHDPYNHLVGLSETVWLKTNVDVGFLHQTRERNFIVMPDDTRPMVMNEPVFSDDTPPLWQDEVIRNPENRLAFRRTFWRNFATGTTGSFEATWLNIGEPPNEAVLAVMDDHSRLAEFVKSLPVNINARERFDSGLADKPGYQHYGTQWDGFEIYYLLKDGNTAHSKTWSVEPAKPEKYQYYAVIEPDKDMVPEWRDMPAGKAFELDTAGMDLIVILSEGKRW